MIPATDFWPLLRERLKDRRFWKVQALVLAVDGLHIAIETVGTFHSMGDVFLLPVSLLVIPILYAAFTFGFEGALATGLWCAALTVRPLLKFHDTGERIEIVVQLAFLVLIGVMVANRVDHERHAKLAAEDANRKLAKSQASLKNFIGLGLRAQEEERFRLSRELHDQTIQELVVAKTTLEYVLGTEGQHTRLEFVDASLERCIDGIRRLCRALRPSVLDDLGLVPALDWLLTDLAGRSKIQIALEAEGYRLLLNPEQELVIFRVAQEALHNVELHAQASQVVVHLTSDPGRLCLEVVDDGCGFDPSLARRSGLGLAGMHERARLIGASLGVSSRPGSTCVRLDLRPGPGQMDGSPPASAIVLEDPARPTGGRTPHPGFVARPATATRPEW
jgi:two-component system, NarL family, sensor histidine kinase DegS